MAANLKYDGAAREIRSVTYLGMAVNIALSVVKIIIGTSVSSLAMLADGVHSFSDLATDAIVLAGSRLGAKEPDQGHPYGHGRIETFAAILVALILMAVGGAMVYKATMAIAQDESTSPHWAILVGALLSIVAKEWLYRVTKRAATRAHSAAVYANAWHHRSDAFSSVAVLIGFVGLLVGFGHGDQVAAVAVGLMVIFVAVRISGDSLMELTERAVDPETVNLIKKVISANKSIRDWHRLRTRTVGREVFLDVHILVDPTLNVAAAHEISEGLERTLDREISRPVNITVHIEPDLPSLRR